MMPANKTSRPTRPPDPNIHWLPVPVEVAQAPVANTATTR